MTDLDQVYREHAATVYRFLLAKCGSEQTAEELTQETFYQAVRSIHRYDGSCKITTWLCGIAKNLLYASYRDVSLQNVPLEEAPEPVAPSAEEEVLADLDRTAALQAIHRAPEPAREVLYLRLLGGLSFREIGAVLGQTETWARVTFYRAKAKLVKELNHDA